LQHGVETTSLDDRRRQAWSFVLSGGAIYSNVDSSYTVADPKGDQTSGQAGRDAPALRNQVKVLKDFVERLDLAHLQPNSTCIQGIPEGTVVHALVDPGNAYAIYLNQGNQATLTLELGTGRYRTEWVNPQTGQVEKNEDLNHPGGPMTLVSPRYQPDIALKILKINP
jgi:hypothetical protein